MKRNLEILKAINREIMDLEGDETNGVLRILRAYSDKPQMAAEKLSEYLSSTLPVKVEPDLMLSIIE